MARQYEHEYDNLCAFTVRQQDPNKLCAITARQIDISALSPKNHSGFICLGTILHSIVFIYLGVLYHV